MSDRVAIVVVAGVGDEGSGENAARIVEGLIARDGWSTAGREVTEWYPVVGDVPGVGDLRSRARAARRFALVGRRDGDDPDEVDVYEFWWADLSRFPAALRSFTAAFLGLFLDMPAIARAALLGGTGIGSEPVKMVASHRGETSVGIGSRRTAARLLGFMGWLCAVPIMVVTFMLLALIGLVSLALYLRSLDADPVATGVALGGAGALLGAAAWSVSVRYQRSGRLFAAATTVLVLAGAAVLVVWRILERGGRPELALGDAVVGTVAFPFRILWIVAILTTAAATVSLLVRLVRVRRHDPREAGPAWRSSVTAVVAATAAPLGVAVLLAALSAGVGAASRPLTSRAEFAGATATAEAAPWCLTGPRDWSPSSQTCTKVAPDGVLSAYDWGVVILGQALAPLIVAAAAAALVGLLVAGFGLARALAAPGQGGARQAERIRRLVALLDQLVGPLLMLLVPIAAYFAVATWVGRLPPGGVWRDSNWLNVTSGSAAFLGGAAAAAILLARFLGLSPGRLAGGGRAKEVLRSILDRPYDIATYLREQLRPKAPGHTRLPRARMLARFGALLEHVCRGGSRGPTHRYDRVIIVAHSQGTVLSVTMLHDPPDGLPADVRLITFGSPLRQLYQQRLPRQFGWVEALVGDPWRYLSERSHLTEWVSLATPGDPVGRTVFATPCSPWRVDTVVHRPAGPALIETTLANGGHSTYWTHPELYRNLFRMIDGAHLPAQPPRDPCGGGANER